MRRAHAAAAALLLLACVLAPDAAAAKTGKHRSGGAKKQPVLCSYCGITRDKLRGLQPLNLLLGAAGDVTCDWGGDVTMVGVRRAAADLGYKLSDKACGGCPRTVRMSNTLLHLNDVLDACTRTEAAVPQCRSTKRAVACG